MDGRQKVDMLEIIRQDVERTGGDFDEVYAGLEKGIESGETRILRHGNTLLIYNILSRGVAEIHLATLDNPRDMMEAFQNFYHAFKVAGFTKLVSEVEDPQLIRLIEMAKIPVQAHQTESGYQITIEVK